MVWLTAVTSETDAGIVQELLAAADLPFYIVRRGAGGYLRVVMGSSVYGQDIYVREEDYDEAAELLNNCCGAAGVSDDELSWQAEHAEEETGLPEESGSYQTFFWILGAIALLILLLALPRILP